MTAADLRALARDRDDVAESWPEYVIVAAKFREDAAALRAAADQLDAVREVVENYGGWYEYSPEDSWRFERDLRKALDMPQYEPEN